MDTRHKCKARRTASSPLLSTPSFSLPHRRLTFSIRRPFTFRASAKAPSCSPALEGFKAEEDHADGRRLQDQLRAIVVEAYAGPRAEKLRWDEGVEQEGVISLSLSLYIYVYIYMYTHTSLYTCVYIYVYIYIYIYFLLCRLSFELQPAAAVLGLLSLPGHFLVNKHIYIYIHIQTLAYLQYHMYMCIYIYICMCVYTCIYIYIYYIYISIYLSISLSLYIYRKR